MAKEEQKSNILVATIKQYRDPAYRRWRVFSTFATGFFIGLFYVLLISGKVLENILNTSGQASLVLIFSGILGGVIYTILVDGHVEMPRFSKDGNKFEAGLFGDILLGIAGAIVLMYIAETLEMSFLEDIENVQLAAVGLVGGYGGRAILQFALNRVFKNVNVVQADREKYLKASYQRRLERLDGLQLVEGLNQQIKVGLSADEWADLSQAIRQAPATVRNKIFEQAKDLRRTATLAGETARVARTIPVFQTLVDSDPKAYRYYAQLAYAYKDSAEPDFFKAIQHLTRAIDLRGNDHQAETWKYELSRAIARIQESYKASVSYDFDAVTNESIIDDLLAVAKIYNLENIVRVAKAKHIPIPVMAWAEHNQVMLASHPKASGLMSKLKAMINAEPDAEQALESRVRSVPDGLRGEGRSHSSKVLSPHPRVTSEIHRWQQAIQRAKATGASAATAGQDRLSFAGVKASHQMAENDWPRVEPLIERFCRAGEKFDLPPELLAAIASRESRCGNALKNGWGDEDNAFGIMQVDKRHHPTALLAGDPTSQQHINQATEILWDGIQQVSKAHPNWEAEYVLRGGVAAYNFGSGNVLTKAGLDQGSTGDDYSSDVIARAQYYRQYFEQFLVKAQPLQVIPKEISISELTMQLQAVDQEIPFSQWSMGLKKAINFGLSEIGLLQKVNSTGDDLLSAWATFMQKNAFDHTSAVDPTSAQALLKALKRSSALTDSGSTRRRNLQNIGMTIPQVIPGCDTGQIQGLSLQVLDKIRTEKPDVLTKIDHPLIVCTGSQNNPYLQVSAYQALVKVVEARNKPLHINSCLRTPMQQHMLRQQYEQGLCGISAAARPPLSNHNSGLAIDVQDPYDWKPFMERHDWKWLGAWDEMHFDYVGAGGQSLGKLQVRAFQELWNEFNPQEPIGVDGSWGPTTMAKANKSPIQGFGNPPVFKKGAFSETVGKLQVMLSTVLQLSPDQLTVDNHFGSQTFRAVSEFQKQMGLTPVDGVVGPETLQKLEELSGKHLF